MTSGWRTKAIYWALPVVLTVVQAWLSFVSRHQIRYEELAESVRSVFWLDHRMVYDGVYTNVGWYALLLATYKLFGFTLFTAKSVRLAIHLIGLLALADLLRRALPMRLAIVPLILIGLSPTLLYFETMEATYGLDLPYSAICLWLLISTRPSFRTPSDIGKTFLLGVVAMMAAMSYPAFLLYAPSFLVVAFWWSRRAGRWNPVHVASVGVGLALPLAAVFLFVRTRALLIYDPVTHAGLFRGGGTLGFDPAAVGRTIRASLGDVFTQGTSYYYEVTNPEFSDWPATLCLAMVVITAVYGAIRRRIDRTLATAIVLLVGISLVMPGLSTEGPPGIRRSTGIIAGYFALVALVWRFYTEESVAGGSVPRRWGARAGATVCLLLLFDTVIKVPSLRSDLAADSLYQNQDWFAIKDTPAASLDFLLTNLEHGKKLECPTDLNGKVLPCRYQEVYPAMAGYLEWNRLKSISIVARDWKTNGDITLTPDIWDENYYPTCTRLEACTD